VAGFFYTSAMANSPAFERIERDTLALSRSIPRGKICTYELLGAAIDATGRYETALNYASTLQVCQRFLIDSRLS
jgi:hypothetical protein